MSSPMAAGAMPMSPQSPSSTSLNRAKSVSYSSSHPRNTLSRRDLLSILNKNRAKTGGEYYVQDPGSGPAD